MTTPAALLRQAADKLRQLATAEGITPGPWLSMDGGDRLLWDGPGAELLPPRYVVDEPMSNGANAALIATLHPGVAVALAAWLESEAQRLGASTHPDWQETVAPHAVAVARAVLGVADPAADGPKPSAPL